MGVARHQRGWGSGWWWWWGGAVTVFRQAIRAERRKHARFALSAARRQPAAAARQCGRRSWRGCSRRRSCHSLLLSLRRTYARSLGSSRIPPSPPPTGTATTSNPLLPTFQFLLCVFPVDGSLQALPCLTWTPGHVHQHHHHLLLLLSPSSSSAESEGFFFLAQ